LQARQIFTLVACFTIFVLLQTVAHCQWQNTDPIWEYEDESPIIPADVRLKVHALNQAYHQAGDYHNDHFLKALRSRDPHNRPFINRWSATFLPRWIAFNDYLDRYKRSVWLHASSVSASGTTINFQHSQLAGATQAVAKNLVATAQGLTAYLEDDKVVDKWEIFINRLKNIVDTLQDLE